MDDALPATKTCSKCGAEKHRIDFYRDSRRPDGLRPECKRCIAPRANLPRAPKQPAEVMHAAE